MNIKHFISPRERVMENQNAETQAELSQLEWILLVGRAVEETKTLRQILICSKTGFNHYHPGTLHQSSLGLHLRAAYLLGQNLLSVSPLFLIHVLSPTLVSLFRIGSQVLSLLPHARKPSTRKRQKNSLPYPHSPKIMFENNKKLH